MSAYCTIDDIQAEIKALTLSTSTIPTLAQVTEFIDQESARINSFLTKRYTLPITGTESLLNLKRICIALVAWRVSDIISTRKQQMLPNGMISQDLAGATAYKAAIKELDGLQKGGVRLPDEVPANSSAGGSFFASGNSENDYKSKFDIDTQQW